LKKLNNGIYNWIFQQCITSVPKLSTELVNDIRDFSKTSTQFQIDDNEKINTKNLANVIVEIIAIPNGKVVRQQRQMSVPTKVSFSTIFLGSTYIFFS
jgi:hypothetical protein